MERLAPRKAGPKSQDWGSRDVKSETETALPPVPSAIVRQEVRHRSYQPKPCSTWSTVARRTSVVNMEDSRAKILAWAGTWS